VQRHLEHPGRAQEHHAHAAPGALAGLDAVAGHAGDVHGRVEGEGPGAGGVFDEVEAGRDDGLAAGGGAGGELAARGVEAEVEPQDGRVGGLHVEHREVVGAGRRGDETPERVGLAEGEVCDTLAAGLRLHRLPRVGPNVGKPLDARDARVPREGRGGEEGEVVALDRGARLEEGRQRGRHLQRRVEGRAHGHRKHPRALREGKGLALVHGPAGDGRGGEGERHPDAERDERAQVPTPPGKAQGWCAGAARPGARRRRCGQPGAPVDRRPSLRGSIAHARGVVPGRFWRADAVKQSAEAVMRGLTRGRVLAVAAAVEVLCAVGVGGRLHPDEVHQYLEPAHRLAFGYGNRAHEWYAGMRNLLAVVSQRFLNSDLLNLQSLKVLFLFLILLQIREWSGEVYGSYFSLIFNNTFFFLRLLLYNFLDKVKNRTQCHFGRFFNCIFFFTMQMIWKISYVWMMRSIIPTEY
jgi:hypothetical protein